MTGLFPEVAPLIIGFILGSIPVGVLVGAAVGVNIRAKGSGNIGATNALRVMGWKAGLFVLLADMSKGVVPVLLARHWLGPDTLGAWAALAGLAAMVGHCFSPFLGFQGGKGVATAFGALLALDWRIGLMAFALFAVLLAIWRYVSLSSIAAATSLFIISAALRQPFTVTIVLAVLGAIVIVRHSANIQRLLTGTENRFGQRKSPEDPGAASDGEAGD